MTDEQIGHAMTDDEIASALDANGHGVLSLGKDNRGYGVPISYAYDVARDRIILEFVNLGESKKAAFIESAEEVTLTVYTYEDPDTWESVIVTGPMRPLDGDDVSDRSAAKFFSQADDVAGELRWRDSDDVDRRWYEIAPADVSGRHGGTLPHQQSGGLLRFSKFTRR